MQVEHEVVFYFNEINKIGGVESWYYYLSKLFKNFVIYYHDADSVQVERLAKNVEIHKHKGEIIKCKRFFGSYGLGYILPYLEAEEKYFVIHCDYKKNKLSQPLIYPGFKYIAVSKLAGESFKELTGIDYELIYNPIAIDKPKVKKKEGLHLVSATRLSSEKGGWRIDKLSELLDNSGIKYTWDIYTNKPKKLNESAFSPNIHIKEPKLDLTKEMSEASYVVQLSDHEAFCFTVAESLVLGTPVIITDLPVFNEIGCNESNSIKLDLNMLNVDIDKIVKGLEPFKYKPPKSNWGKYLDNNSTYNPNDIVNTRIIKRYTDVVLKKKLLRGTEEPMTKIRASVLEAKGLVEW